MSFGTNCQNNKLSQSQLSNYSFQQHNAISGCLGYPPFRLPAEIYVYKATNALDIPNNPATNIAYSYSHLSPEVAAQRQYFSLYSQH